MTRSVVTEPLRPVELYAIDRQALRQSLDAALTRITKKLDTNIAAFGDSFPAKPAKRASGHAPKNVEWTTSFWTGQLWLAWEMTGEASFREAAERTLPSFLRTALRSA